MSDNSADDSKSPSKGKKAWKREKRAQTINPSKPNSKKFDFKSKNQKDSNADSTAGPSAANSQADGEYIFESPEQQALRNEGNEFFKDKKKRRQSSSKKKFFNDHIGLSEVAEVSDLLASQNDEGILFSDRTSRLSHRSHMSECICIISTNYLYILNSHLHNEEDIEPLPISSIQKIVTSQEADNAVIIFFPDFKTQLLMTPYKIELMMILKQQYKQMTGNELEFNFLDFVDFPVNEDTLFEVNFVHTADGVRMTLFCKADDRQIQK